AVCEELTPPSVGLLADQACRIGGEAGRTDQAGGGDHALVGLRGPGVVWRGVGGEAVRELEGRGPQAAGGQRSRSELAVVPSAGPGPRPASAPSPLRRGAAAAKRAERIRQAVATTPLSAFAAPGSCGEASGSSQSPNWKPVSHRPLGDSARSTNSRWSTMPG